MSYPRTESARDVKTIGTRAPSTIPAASALVRKVRFFASMFPASEAAKLKHRKIDHQTLAALADYLQKLQASSLLTTPDRALEDWLRRRVGAPPAPADVEKPAGPVPPPKPAPDAPPPSQAPEPPAPPDDEGGKASSAVNASERQ